MKYLVLLVVLVVAYMLWRNARLAERKAREEAQAPPRPVAGPQDMVSCADCGLHLPKSEAVTGAQGRTYCSHEHRLRSGG